MSFWNSDGSAILIDNLNGKAIERINVLRDASGQIIDLEFDKTASLGFGKNMAVVESATYFLGSNALNTGSLLGKTVGTYEEANLGDLTPAGVCKENGCSVSCWSVAIQFLCPGCLF